jgi:hypothetical protein
VDFFSGFSPSNALSGKDRASLFYISARLSTTYGPSGIMDWQHRMHGHWTNLIISKFILAGVLATLLGLTVALHQKAAASNRVMMLLYALCLATAMAIGYVGGQLVYG